ncbi:hypothetical protein ACOTDL_04030 [Achromobacter xylosoxidans]
MSKFPNDRPLTEFDREHRLLQKKRLDVPLLAQLCVVRMNSNSLLSVDRWYAWRGFVALLGGDRPGLWHRRRPDAGLDPGGGPAAQ